MGLVQDGDFHPGVGAVEVGSGAPDCFAGGGEGAVELCADGVGFFGEDGADAEFELGGVRRVGLGWRRGI